jgi:alginate O-acetyltransferase complex protein AlgI
MLFTNPIFFILLPLSLFLFYLAKTEFHQIIILTITSFGFYSMERPEFSLLLAASVAFNTFTSYRSSFSPSRGQRRSWAWVGAACNLFILVFFKYSGLFAKTFGVDSNSSLGDILLNIPLPVGISFFTFQGISLVVDAYREGAGEGSHVVAPENWRRHSMQTFFYISFFPHLAAGPIVKAKHFLPQIKRKRFSDLSWDYAINALIIGYFLKCVVADNLKEHTFWLTYPYFMSFSSVNLLFLLLGYSAQIFADFAGYSSIAIGVAGLYGYELPINFNYPYISQSFSEFWTRWHISLSSWLREYLYFPLGGNRQGQLKTYRNLMIIMILGGLWHGAAWSYAVWGGVHGIALVFERGLQDLAEKYRLRIGLPPLLKVGIVFCVVTAAWLLFRLPNFSHVMAFCSALADNTNLRVQPGNIFYICSYSTPVLLMHLYGWFKAPMSLRYPSIFYGWRFVSLVLMCFMLAVSTGPEAAFIYFQF